MALFAIPSQAHHPVLLSSIVGRLCHSHMSHPHPCLTDSGREPLSAQQMSLSKVLNAANPDS